MDYKTKALGRGTIRRFSIYMRELFDVSETGSFPVMDVLDKINDVFPGSNYIIVEDDSFDNKTMARCMENEAGGYTIEIKESVYMGAYTKGIPAYIGFIMHEICHVFLFYLGYKPIFERSFEDNTIERCCSVEWQAKALCGEVMIPFEESKGIKRDDLMKKYKVSKGMANFRRQLDGVSKCDLIFLDDNI